MSTTTTITQAGRADDAMMGPLEAEQYAKAWRRSYRFRKGLADTTAASGGGFGALREAARLAEAEDEEEEASKPSQSAPVSPPTLVAPDEVAARLLFARLFDARPDLLRSVRSAAPTVVIDVADDTMFGSVTNCWHEVLYPEKVSLNDVADDRLRRRRRPDALYLVVKEPPKSNAKASAESRALAALSLALPFFAISPLATTHLPQCVLKAASDRLEIGSLDPATIARIIRVVTGKPCREAVEPRVASAITLIDLVVAVRFDRSPGECIEELRRLATDKDKLRKSRDLTLSQLHGLGEARAWAESAIADIQAWKAGEIGWDAVASAVALTGPPGTGKTTFAKVFAAEAGLDLITATLAKWQSSGEAHLGHLLRAMRQDFDAARSRAPCALFIDEIDSFPDRAGLTHQYKDYVIEVVNALLEQIDGIAGREGVVVIGASNDLTRCDPALLRSGRLDRIVKIGLPDAVELEKMLRVRLGTDLADVDLRFLADAAVGMTGADVERLVKDAKRAARQADRDITIEDVRGALVEEDERPPELRWRACLHEAAHIVVDVVHFGAEDIFASSAIMGSSGGRSVRLNPPRLAGTYSDYHKRLQIILAGGLGEELVLSESSSGAGGSPGSDLDQATRMAAAMAGSIGLSGPTPLVYRGSISDAAEFLTYEDIRIAVDEELSKAAASCRELLEVHRIAVEAVAKVLFERTRIDGVEVAEILAQHDATGTAAASPHLEPGSEEVRPGSPTGRQNS